MNLLEHFKILLKELKKNKSRISKVFASIFISLFIFSSVTILKNGIDNEIKNNSRVFLGGDLELSSKNNVFDSDLLKKLKEFFFVTEVIEFTTILRTDTEESRTTRIKVIDNLYPLVGEVKSTPSNSLEKLNTKLDTILIDETTKKNLDLKIGDEIKIQKTSFEVVGVIESLPDIGSIFVFGDQALISKSSFKSLKVNNLGSFIKYKYKMTEKNNNQKLPDEIRKNQNIVVKYPDDVSQNLKKIIENFIFFLSIISASTILISGIGLKNSLFAFLSDNKLKIAIYKSLGFSSRNIKLLYYSQAIMILIFCSFGAYILGLFTINILSNILINFLNIELKVSFSLFEFFIIQFLSLSTFFIFAKPVMDSIDKIKVADLFRNSSTNLNLNYSKRSIIEISIFLLIFVFSFCIFNVQPLETAIFFIFLIIISFFFYLFSKVYISLLNKIKNIKSLSVYMGIKNLKAFSSLNSITIMTMGIGLSLLFFLGFLSSNINKELNGTIPENAPQFFFLGIQKSELKSFSEQITSIESQSELKIFPMISARIETIENKPTREIIDEKNESFWFVNGERRISWLENPPHNNRITKGEWWYDDNEDNLKVSLDQKVANDLKLKIGDSMTFNIYGNSVLGIITNFRKVDYKDLNVNFAVLFNPKFASKIPHEFISTVKFKNEKTVNLSNLLKELPAITYIKVSDYIKKTKIFLNKLFIISILISGTVIVIGFFVISNAINVIGNLKIYQNLVLTILGIRKLKILKLVLFESFLLFIPIVLFSLLFSSIFSYIFTINFLNINWFYSFNVSSIISFLFLLILLMTQLIFNLKYLKLNPYFLLRNG